MGQVCIYHNVDLDGFCSAAIWREAKQASTSQLIGMNYGDSVPWDRLEGADVTMVDFCLQPFSEFVRLLQTANSLTWIDHHRSTIKDWEEGNIPANHCPVRARLSEGRAACELAWEFYYPDSPMPIGVLLLGDYDSWRHKEPDTMVYQMGMRLRDMNPISETAMTYWRYVFSQNAWFYKLVTSEGSTILKYQSQTNARSVKAIWFPVEFAGYRWMAVNQGGVNSQFWDAVWDYSFDGKLSFVRSRSHWTCSLYSDTVDCSEIAKQQGGGGHPGAAGFQCQSLPFRFPI